ncbi:hypothetical protein L7F22_023645 [Adiantum nelumboides]|nr:hypothetical protein [Adiantum nelumboides]
MGTATFFGATFGLACQFYSNAIRKQPLMRHPWEHVLLMSIGIVVANGLANWEKKLEADVERHMKEDAELNRSRFKGILLASHKGKVVKLSNRYYGPFKIIDKVNDVTFRLDLPPSWKIHNAFHASLLRPYMGPSPSEPVTDELPEIEEMEETLEPEQIVHHQARHLKSRKITRKYLVKFKNYSALDAQWMTEQDLRAYSEILDGFLQALQLRTIV